MFVLQVCICRVKLATAVYLAEEGAMVEMRVGMSGKQKAAAVRSYSEARERSLIYRVRVERK